ncbi:MAG: TetR family transcriptional regulator [Hyphomonadaceae bacterium]|nr:TetR family transcriptional regulator [Hyphomonadaceae bacterium]
MSITKNRKVRVRRAPEAARDNILSAAERLLVESGPLALKLSEVAAAAGVANASVLHHFGSIDGLHAALMDRMVEQLAADVLALADQSGDVQMKQEAVVQALFDVFEKRGAARLAAWLELTGEWRRLTSVRQAVQQVVAKRAALGDLDIEATEDLVLISVVLAMGAGLFGAPLARLVGSPAGRTRKVAADALRAYAALGRG